MKRFEVECDFLEPREARRVEELLTDIFLNEDLNTYGHFNIICRVNFGRNCPPELLNEEHDNE